MLISRKTFIDALKTLAPLFGQRHLPEPLRSVLVRASPAGLTIQVSDFTTASSQGVANA